MKTVFLSLLLLICLEAPAQDKIKKWGECHVCATSIWWEVDAKERIIWRSTEGVWGYTPDNGKAVEQKWSKDNIRLCGQCDKQYGEQAIAYMNAEWTHFWGMAVKDNLELRDQNRWKNKRRKLETLQSTIDSLTKLIEATK